MSLAVETPKISQAIKKVRNLAKKKNNKPRRSAADDESVRGNMDKKSSYGFKKMPSMRTTSVLSTNKVKKFKKKTGGKGKMMINNYEIIETLGKGSFATVKLCKDTKSGTLYAIKQMNKKDLKRKN